MCPLYTTTSTDLKIKQQDSEEIEGHCAWLSYHCLFLTQPSSTVKM